MRGPYKIGTVEVRRTITEFSWEKNRLLRGREYKVARQFKDSDGDGHEVGERWKFLGTMFSKFDNELILCVRNANGEEWQIPLVGEKGKQQTIIQDWKDYFSPA